MTVPVRVPQRAARRRADILRTARRLFAADGVGPVTPGRIAKEAGISAGNLYYWFGSKAEIVRELFAQWIADSGLPGDLAEDPAPAPAHTLALLWGRIPAQHRINDDYAFFQRELLPLLNADPVLAEEYRRNHAARVDRFVELTEQVIAAGLLHAPRQPASVRELVDVLWLVAETAGPFARATGDGDLDATRLARAVIGPLLTDAGRAALALDPAPRSSPTWEDPGRDDPTPGDRLRCPTRSEPTGGPHVVPS